MNNHTNMQYYTEELVSNPSNITQHIVEIVVGANTKYEDLLNKKVSFRRFALNVKLNMYLKNDFHEFYQFLCDYKAPEFNTFNKKERLQKLFNEFKFLYEKLIFNNIALAYHYALNKQLSSSVMTKEDEKILCLKKYFHHEITIEQFKEKFGHYALNAYELSSKRFEEYTAEELRPIAKLVSNFKIKEKTSLEKYISSPFEDVTPILIALRELAKYKILFLVKSIRYELLGIAKDNNIDNIFDKHFSQIIG